MTNKTRKRLWPVSLVMAVAIVGVVAAFLMVASSPSATQAHDNGVAGGNHCNDLSGLLQDLHDDNSDHTCAEGIVPTPTPMPTATPVVHRFAPSAPDSLMVSVEEKLIRAPMPNPTGAASHYRIDATVTWALPAYIGPDLNSDGNPDSEIMSYTIYRMPGDGSDAMKMIQVNKYVTRNPDVPNPDFHNRRFVDMGLAYDTTYTYTIMASSNLYGRSPLSDGMDVTTQSQASSIVERFAPTEPMNVRAFALDNAITVRWNQPQYIGPSEHNPRITHYVIERNAYVQDPNSPIRMTGHKIITVAGSVMEYRDQGLAYNTTYTYRVAAHSDLYGQGSWSAPYTLTTATSGGRLDPELAPPSAPRSVKAAEQCADQITITWMPPAYAGQAAAVFPGCATCTDQTPPHVGGEHAGIEVKPGEAVVVSYMIERRIGLGLWQVVASDVTDLEWIDDDPLLAYGNQYSYRVSALNNADLYGPSDMDMLTLDEPPVPVMPENLVYQQDGDTVELEWQMPRDSDALWRDADFRAGEESRTLEYVLERKIGESGVWMEFARVHHKYADRFQDRRTQTHGDLVSEIPGLQGEQKVSYRVSALVNECNRSPAHQRNAITVAVAPPEPVGNPTAVSAMSAGAGSATITWNAAPNATNQWVYAHNYATGLGDYVASVAGDATSATVTGLTSGSYAFIAVAGQTVGDETSYSGWSNWSGIVTVQ